jgi:hypothetical protein
LAGTDDAKIALFFNMAEMLGKNLFDALYLCLLCVLSGKKKLRITNYGAIPKRQFLIRNLNIKKDTTKGIMHEQTKS